MKFTEFAFYIYLIDLPY